MQTLHSIESFRPRKKWLVALLTTGVLCTASIYAGFAQQPMRSMAVEHMSHAHQDAHTTMTFSGVKVNGGTVTHIKDGKRNILTLSDDFQIPDSPAPHWQVVNSKGNVYLLQRLKIKGDKFNKQIVLPTYIKDVAKVQIWCSWAEALLGEASFPAPVK